MAKKKARNFKQAIGEQTDRIILKIKENKNKIQHELKNKEKSSAIAFLSILIVIFIILSLLVSFNQEAILDFAKNSPYRILIFLLLLCVEVIIAPIPGGIIGLTIASTLPVFDAFWVIYLGGILGAMASYYFSVFLGKKYITAIVSPKKLQKSQLFLHKHARWLPLIYAVPVFPLDIFNFICGMLRVPIHLFARAIIIGYFIYALIIVSVGAILSTWAESFFHLAGTLFFYAITIGLIIQLIRLLYTEI